MIIVGMTARPYTMPTWIPERGVTENSFSRNGTNITRLNRITPARNAPRLYQLLAKPSRKIEWRLLQLNPWNNRERVRVQNAMVLAVDALPCFKPMWKAVMVHAAISAPCTRIFSIKSLDRIPSFGSLGFLSSRPCSAGSIPIAIAGRESVSRLMNSR